MSSAVSERMRVYVCGRHSCACRLLWRWPMKWKKIKKSVCCVFVVFGALIPLCFGAKMLCVHAVSAAAQHCSALNRNHFTFGVFDKQKFLSLCGFVRSFRWCVRHMVKRKYFGSRFPTMRKWIFEYVLLFGRQHRIHLNNAARPWWRRATDVDDCHWSVHKFHCSHFRRVDIRLIAINYYYWEGRAFFVRPIGQSACQ